MTASLLSPKAVADRTGLANQTLANWRSLKTGPPWVKVGRLVRYPEDRLETWLAENAKSQ